MKNRIEIRNERSVMRDVEIEMYKDFDQLLHARDKALLIRKRWIWSVGLLTLLVGFWLLSNQLPQNNTPDQTRVPIIKQTNPTIVDSLESPLKSPPEVKKEVQREQNIQKFDQQEDSEKVEPKPAIKKESGETDTEQKYAYEEAYPVEGMPALYLYFDDNLTYPEAALPDSVEGTVFIRFKINTSGEAVDIEVEQSMGNLFDQEAIRLIQNMPEWRPASINGTPITSTIRIPIHFNIESTNHEK